MNIVKLKQKLAYIYTELKHLSCVHVHPLHAYYMGEYV